LETGRGKLLCVGTALEVGMSSGTDIVEQFMRIVFFMSDSSMMQPALLAKKSQIPKSQIPNKSQIPKFQNSNGRGFASSGGRKTAPPLKRYS
jgi:hypothetical protein